MIAVGREHQCRPSGRRDVVDVDSVSEHTLDSDEISCGRSLPQSLSVV